MTVSPRSSSESMSSTPTSPTSSIRSSESSCSEISEHTYRELQFENHSLRKRLREDHQRYAIVLEKFREGERAALRMQDKVKQLQASLEEANAKILDVLEENHELRRSFIELQKSSAPPQPAAQMQRAATEPVHRPQRETFLEDTIECDDEIELEAEAPRSARPLLEDALANDDTPKAKARPSKLQALQTAQRSKSPDPVPLSPLSLNAPPTHRRDAISAAEDSALAQCLQQMSVNVLPPSVKQHRSRSKQPSSQSPGAKGTTRPGPRSQKTETVPPALSSAKRLPRSREGYDMSSNPWMATTLSAAG